LCVPNKKQQLPATNALITLPKNDFLPKSVRENEPKLVKSSGVSEIVHLLSPPPGSYNEQLHSPVSLPKPAMYFMTNHTDSLKTYPRLDRVTTDEPQKNEPKKPDLDKVSDLLTFDLHNFFVRPCDYTYYRDDIIFEDNIRGKRLEGIVKYRNAVNLTKIVCHFRFVYVRFHILGVTEHPEDGTIRVRWRIAGMGMLKMCLKYIPAQMWKRGNLDKAADSWYDGYSTFYVDDDNMIYKHRADKVMPDEDQVSVKKQLAEKLQKLKPQPAPVL